MPIRKFLVRLFRRNDSNVAATKENKEFRTRKSPLLRKDNQLLPTFITPQSPRQGNTPSVTNGQNVNGSGQQIIGTVKNVIRSVVTNTSNYTIVQMVNRNGLASRGNLLVLISVVVAAASMLLFVILMVAAFLMVLLIVAVLLNIFATRDACLHLSDNIEVATICSNANSVG